MTGYSSAPRPRTTQEGGTTPNTPDTTRPPAGSRLTTEGRAVLRLSQYQAATSSTATKYRDLLDAASEHIPPAAGGWRERIRTMPPEALAEAESLIRFGESIAYPEGYEQGVRDGYLLGVRVGEARGRYLEASEIADSLRWSQGEHNRALARDLASRPPYAERCDRRGEHERAERARTLLAERRIA